MAYYQPPAYPPYAPSYANSNNGYGWQPNYYQNQPPQPPLPAPEALPPPPATVTQPQAQAPVAYTRVTPKTSMARTSGQEERKSGWPESLRSFTQRAFIGARTPEDKAQLQVFLKELINTTQKRGELWTRDWAAMPLPDCSRPLEDRMKESPHGSSSTRSAMSIIRPPSPFRMTFRKQPLKRDRSPSLDTSRSSSPPRALTKKERKALRKQEQERKRMVHSLKAPHSMQDPQEDFHDVEREQARARRFGNGSALGAVSGRAQRGYYSGGYDEWDDAEACGADAYEGFQSASAVKGTCQELEKSYFRLTSKPDPSAVRPETVLKRALARLVRLLRNKQVTYFYAADQFKGMRQDCTVQHLCNEVSASIYEAHARCALEHGDTAEYNQCQAQLLQHYQAGITAARQEFTAYRLLHQAAHAGRGNHAGILNCLQSITLEVCSLYASTSNMGRALLDIVLPRLRLTSAKILAKAYLPHLPVSVIATRLAFLKPLETPHCPPEHPSADLETLPGSTTAAFLGRHAPEEEAAVGESACIAWLQEHGAVLIPSPGGKGGMVMDCKASVNSLKAPEQSSAAPHGPDLAIDDFLARAVA